MVLDPEIDAAYPERWIGLVEVETADGEILTSRVETPKGDPGNALSRGEIEEKTKKLAEYGGGTSSEDVQRIIERAWNLENEGNLRDLLPTR